MKLHGVFAPIPTPFDEQGTILHEHLRDNILRWCASGLHGLVVLGSNGESVMLSDDEKRAVWQTARAAIPTGTLFIAGLSTESLHASLCELQAAAAVGADAALVADAALLQEPDDPGRSARALHSCSRRFAHSNHPLQYAW